VRLPIQAPPIPKLTSASGMVQQAEAATAAPSAAPRLQFVSAFEELAAFEDFAALEGS